MTTDNRIAGLSAADLAAIDAIAAANMATNEALAELARAVATRHGVELPASQPNRPAPQRQKSRSYRLTNVTKGLGGEMTGDVEYDDARVRRFHLSRNGSGDLVGDIEDLDRAADAAPAPAADAGPATEATPGDFSDVFGSLDGA